MLQSIMGYGYPPVDRQKDRHVSKHYLPVVLCTQVVTRKSSCLNARGLQPNAYQVLLMEDTPPLNLWEGTWDQSLGYPYPEKDMGLVEVLWDGDGVLL